MNRTHAWFGIAVIVLVAINLRPAIVSVGPLLPSIQWQFGLSHGVASLLVAIPDLLMGLLALPTPFLAWKFGRNRLVVTALALLCGSTLMRALSPNTTMLLLSTAGVGAGIAIAGTLIGGFIKQNYPGRTALVMGIYATALSLGSTLSAGLTGPVAAASGSWRVAAALWGALCLVGVVAWLLLSLRERRSALSTITQPARVRLPLGKRIAWLIALFFACDNLMFYALLSWTSPMYHDLGLSSVKSGWILASFTAAFMCASPVFGWLSRANDRRGWLALASALTLTGLVVTALKPTLAPLLFVPLCAFGLGAGFTLGMTLPLDNTHSVEGANAWNAFVMTVGYLIAATGPVLTGVLRDLTGDFAVSLWCLVGVAIVMLAITPFLRPGPTG